MSRHFYRIFRTTHYVDCRGMQTSFMFTIDRCILISESVKSVNGFGGHDQAVGADIIFLHISLRDSVNRCVSSVRLDIRTLFQMD